MQFAAASQQQHHHSNSNNDGSLGKHVSSHRRPFTVFVGNLSFFCKEEHLVDLFKKYGPVLKVTVARNVDMANNSLLYGYVEFERAEDASKAMDGTHGNLFMGRRLRVFTLSSPPQTNTINKPSEYYSVHVNFVTHDAKKVVHEEFLHDLFSQHGSIVDIAIRRYFRQQRRQYGYAFVDFYDREAANRAAEQYAHQNIDGIRLQSTLGYRSMDHSSGPSAESKAPDSHADRRQSSHDVAPKSSHGRSPVSVEQVHRHPSPTNGPVVQLQSAPVFPKVPIAQTMPSPSSPTNSYMPMPQMPMFSSGSPPPMPHFPMQYMLPPQSHNYPMYMPQMAYFIPQNTNNNNHHTSNKNASNTNESGSPMIVPPQPQMYYYIPHPSYNPAMVMSHEGHAASQEALSASN